ncbi:orotidine 5'-phosphate decarboxylase [Vermiconidia calcicola]|uniref:Orotidine 5'-phosphate decarboxylase n=1 Tax=Vermiconidia calcicola TaxID=1690605 RepID=A0ACC3NY20_9PEZI|nr:orotidine 5'-phosphate decarboxylase [Vermiconidia calcicola]
MPPSQRHPTLYQSYGERSEHPSLTPLATYLLRLIHIKKTNLCVSADVSTTSELLQLAEDVGDEICVLKTHCDIVKDFSDKTMKRLTETAKRKRFVIFEDRKFGDIGNTVQQQYLSGPLSIVRWAPIVNAHIFPGPAIITALSEAAQKAIAAYNTSVQTDISASPAASAVGGDNDSVHTNDEMEVDDSASVEEEPPEYDDRQGRKHSVVSVSTTISTKTEAMSPQPALRATLSRGSTEEEDTDETEDPEVALEELGPVPFYRSLLLLAQMSSKDNFFSPEYTEACVKHARSNKNFVMGFIAQRSLNSERDDNFITMTPGVQLQAGGDALGQQYNTPRKVIGEAGSDVIIVGRGVLGASDRRRAAHEYRRQGWKAYEERLRAGRRGR